MGETDRQTDRQANGRIEAMPNAPYHRRDGIIIGKLLIINDWKIIGNPCNLVTAN